MTPGEAQKMAEEKWKAIAAGNRDIHPNRNCGWCEFGKALGGTGRGCLFCPVLRVHGVSCVELQPLGDFLDIYSFGDYAEEARAVYEFLCQMGPQYIAAAHEILEELDAR